MEDVQVAVQVVERTGELRAWHDTRSRCRTVAHTGQRTVPSDVPCTAARAEGQCAASGSKWGEGPHEPWQRTRGEHRLLGERAVPLEQLLQVAPRHKL